MRAVFAAVATVALLAAGCSGQAASSTTVTTTVPTTVTATTTEPAETITSTVTATAAAEPTSAESSSPSTAEEGATAQTTAAAAQNFKGTGDDVISLDGFTDLAVLTFTCANCQHNTTVETDGYDGLLVNTIGSYTGSHIVNMKQGSVINTITVGAQGAWILTLDDYGNAPDKTSGSGDTALLIRETATKATITYTGEHNFAVKVYSASGDSDLAVNTIGSYKGTVPFNTPGLVQISASGPWTLDLS